MAGWHQTIIVGNVGRVDDPGLRYTQSGAAVLSFSVAVTERWNDRQSNQRQEKTTWYRVTCWRQLAETMAQFIEVGKQVMVVGNVEADAYMNKNNEPAASLTLTARDIQLLGSRGESGGGGGGNYSGNRGGGGGDGYEDDFSPPPRQVDDIPF